MSQTRTMTSNKKARVLEKTDGHCAYCGRDLTLNNMTIDHIVPLAYWDKLGNPEESVNNIENLLPCCYYCNRLKRQMTLESFRAEIERAVCRLRDANGRDFKLAARFGKVKVSNQPVEFYFEKLTKVR